MTTGRINQVATVQPRGPLWPPGGAPPCGRAVSVRVVRGYIPRPPGPLAGRSQAPRAQGPLRLPPASFPRARPPQVGARTRRAAAWRPREGAPSGPQRPVERRAGFEGPPSACRTGGTRGQRSKNSCGPPGGSRGFGGPWAADRTGRTS